MTKDFHFKVYSNLLAAAHINNTTMMDDKLTILDCNILCLVKSFHDSDRECYMTNEQLARTFLSCERTIKSSLKRLYWRGFLKHSMSAKKRTLVYQPEEVDKFIQKMLLQCKICTP